MSSVLTVVGARPQFVKSAPVSAALMARGLSETVIHTGQHYDENMSGFFFRDLGIPNPKYNLEVGSGPHGWQTGRIMEKVEEICLLEKPDWFLVYGDTNSTLAGALAASKLNIPVIHVEAGLRSFNRKMPEEINRVLTDHLSSLLFCPTAVAVENLRGEGITDNVFHIGDVMWDAAKMVGDAASLSGADELLKNAGLSGGEFVLATVHRAENTDDPGRLGEIFDGLSEIASEIPVYFPMHPRTRKRAEEFGLMEKLAGVTLAEPLGFLEMVCAETVAKMIVTDSGGVQKESYFHGKPCLTLRKETEWIETVEAGWNRLVEPGDLADAVRQAQPGSGKINEYGNGNAAGEFVKILEKQNSKQR